MSSDLFEVLSLAARYLFSLLGVLIVLRSFVWLFSDHSAKRRSVRRLPFSGTVGELTVLNGAGELPEGLSIPVPWEGILGSVRSCDIVLPCGGVARRHLSFSYQQDRGLLLQPFSGREARADGALVNCHTRPESAPLRHGSVLQVGSAQLRLQIYAGLDPRAGLPADAAAVSPSVPQPVPVPVPSSDPLAFPSPASEAPFSAVQPLPMNPVSGEIPARADFPAASVNAPAAAAPLCETHFMQTAPDSGAMPMHADPAASSITDPGVPVPSESRSRDSEAAPESGVSPTGRRRRSDRWEADWSE